MNSDSDDDSFDTIHMTCSQIEKLENLLEGNRVSGIYPIFLGKTEPDYRVSISVPPNFTSGTLRSILMISKSSALLLRLERTYPTSIRSGTCIRNVIVHEPGHNGICFDAEKEATKFSLRDFMANLPIQFID